MDKILSGGNDDGLYEYPFFHVRTVRYILVKFVRLNPKDVESVIHFSTFYSLYLIIRINTTTFNIKN